MLGKLVSLKKGIGRRCLLDVPCDDTYNMEDIGFEGDIWKNEAAIVVDIHKMNVRGSTFKETWCRIINNKNICGWIKKDYLEAL